MRITVFRNGISFDEGASDPGLRGLRVAEITKTWRWKGGIARFHLTMPSGGVPAVAMCRATAALFTHILQIGAVRELWISTYSEGEHGLTWTDGLDGERIEQRLQEIDDLWGLLANCNLHVTDDDGCEFVIDDGLRVRFQLDEDIAPPGEMIDIVLTLNTDVYLATTWGEDRDNRVLAARYAPRFNKFLAELARDIGATVSFADTDDYIGQVDLTGIVLARRS